MRSFSAFVIGVLAGAMGVLAAQRMCEMYEEKHPEGLTDRMDSRLKELEGRLEDAVEAAS